MKLQKDLREFIELLNSRKIKYLLVGGHAVAYHGFPRFTADIDFFVENSAENIAALGDVLTAFGFGSLAGEMKYPVSAGTMFQLGRAPNRIDLLISVSGVAFEEAWNSREKAVFDGLEIPTINKPLLLRNKKASGRPKDLEDIHQLGGE